MESSGTGESKNPHLVLKSAEPKDRLDKAAKLVQRHDKEIGELRKDVAFLRSVVDELLNAQRDMRKENKRLHSRLEATLEHISAMSNNQLQITRFLRQNIITDKHDKT